MGAAGAAQSSGSSQAPRWTSWLKEMRSGPEGRGLPAASHTGARPSASSQGVGVSQSRTHAGEWRGPAALRAYDLAAPGAPLAAGTASPGPG